MRKQKGFSLIELLIVVAIILIIAAIAIPNLLRSRIAANESSAVGSVRTITTAQITYASTYPDVGFADKLKTLGPPASGANPDSTAAGLLDNVLGCGTDNCTKGGYTFTLADTTGTPIADFLAKGEPVTYQSSGVRVFCSTADGVVRSKDEGSATGAATRSDCTAYMAIQ